MRPLKRAETGPTLAATTTCHSVSVVRSRDSHPGIASLSTAGSLRAVQTTSGGAFTMRVLVISIRGTSPPTRVAMLPHDPLPARRQRLGEIGERLQVVDRQEIIDLRQ